MVSSPLARRFYQQYALFFRWFCHFDDDNYVNIPALVKKLTQFDPSKDWFLGRSYAAEEIQRSVSTAKKMLF